MVDKTADDLDDALQLRAAELRALKPGWDNCDGQPISEAAIQAALKVLRSVGRMTPTTSGGVQIDWQDTGIAFGPNGERER